MGLLSMDISDGISYSPAVKSDQDWIQEANLWQAVLVPDLSYFAAGELEDGFAACGWCFECDPDTVSGQNANFIHGLVWMKSLYSYPACDVVIEDNADTLNIGTWGHLLYDNNAGDPLLVLGGMHEDDDELSHRLGIIDNDGDSILVGYWISTEDVIAHEDPLLRASTCQYIMVGNYDDDGDEAVCASYWSYRPGNHQITLEDTAVYDNEINEPLYGYDNLNVFATAVVPSVPPPTSIYILMSGRQIVRDEWGVLIAVVTIDTSTPALCSMSSPTFLEINDFPQNETEFEAHSFVWDTVAPIHGLGTGSFKDLGRICVFEI